MKNNLSAKHITGTHYMWSTVKNNGLVLDMDAAVRDISSMGVRSLRSYKQRAINAVMWGKAQFVF